MFISIAHLQRVLKLTLTITWKLHMVCVHLEPLLTKLGTGLAIVCEQAGEAVHCKYKRTKSRYQLNQHHTKHGEAQKAAVVQWSSWNVPALSRNTIAKYKDKYRSRIRQPKQI